jgi:predicted transcriptional regulator
VATQRPAISDTELEVLKVLWDRSEGTVREILEELKPQKRWAYTTVQTLLNRLQTKGYLRSDRSGSAHIYRPAVSRDQLLQLRLNDLSRKLCEGTASPLVMALVEGVRFTPEEIDQLRKLLNQLEEPKDDPPSGKK